LSEETLNSSSNKDESQGSLSEEIQEIVDRAVAESKKELLDHLVWLGVLNYSSFDEVYFVWKDGYLHFISKKVV
jgi:hypothetical protein